MTTDPTISQAMDATIISLKLAVRDSAEKEREYRKLKAQKWVEARASEDVKQAKDREAWVDGQCADIRFKRDLADGMRSALMEEVRNLRAQMSYSQSLMRADAEEKDMYMHGQSGQT